MVWILSSEQKLTGGISFIMQFPMATVKKNALYTTWMRNATSWWDTFDVPKNWKEINRHKRISLREIATQLAQVRSAHDQWPTLWQLTSVNLWICDCDWHYQFLFFFCFSLVFSLNSFCENWKMKFCYVCKNKECNIPVHIVSLFLEHEVDKVLGIHVVYMIEGR
jgi:hypothetical protein